MIALLTDFGYSDNYAGILKGTIKSINETADIIDINHDVKSYSIANAQFHLFSSYRYFPKNTIFLVIVDPGVGSDRRCLAVRDRGYFYILPDNGILSAVYTGAGEIYEIDRSLFPGASSTFHGRDIFAPVAAEISLGRDIKKFGPRRDNFVEKKFPAFNIIKESYGGYVIHIDRFGNAITSIPNSVIGNGGPGAFTASSEGKTFNLEMCRTYSGIREGMTGLVEGSSGLLEIALFMGSAAEKYGLNIDDGILLSYEQ